MAMIGCSGGGCKGPEDIKQLLEHDIPQCRHHLQENYANLDNVATYCLNNYRQAPDKEQALEETKNYTTQSLASVAYQINELATNFLGLLDLQMGQVSEMESNINHLSQTVMIHKEKVARREIGELTSTKLALRPPGIKTIGVIYPDQLEPKARYVRKPVDLGALDDIGHGVKVTQLNHPAVRVNNPNAQRQPGAAGTPSMGVKPTLGQTPPSIPSLHPGVGGDGSLRKDSISSAYRTSSTPTPVPGSSPGSLATGSVQRRDSAASGKLMTTPISQLPSPTRTTQFPAPLLNTPDFAASATDYRISQHSTGGNARSDSPPLPPPPPGDDQMTHAPYDSGSGDGTPRPYDGSEYGEEFTREDYASRMSRAELDAVPQNFIEKVIAIYSYQQDKADELSFEEGAVIYIINKNDDGWWEGVLDGQTGLFPGNYVEPCI